MKSPFIRSSAKAKADPDYYRAKVRRSVKKLAALVPGRDDVKISDCHAQIDWAERMVQVANNLLKGSVIDARGCPLCGRSAGIWCGLDGARAFLCLPRWDPAATAETLTRTA